jgi:phage-related protein
VLEICEDFSTDTYRVVYTVHYEEAVYVLHSFKKQSSQGIKTPQRDLDIIEKRLKIAEEYHKTWQKREAEEKPKRPSMPSTPIAKRKKR